MLNPGQKFIKKPGKKDKKKGEGEKIPEEIIIKRCTFATFYCDLHSVNWSDQYVDFIWADFPTIGDMAIPVEGSLKPEIYIQGKGKKNKDKGGKKSSKSAKSVKSDVPQPPPLLPLPTKLTCHVGFGIKRYGMVEEIVVKAKKKK